MGDFCCKGYKCTRLTNQLLNEKFLLTTHVIIIMVICGGKCVNNCKASWVINVNILPRQCEKHWSLTSDKNYPLRISLFNLFSQFKPIFFIYIT